MNKIKRPVAGDRSDSQRMHGMSVSRVLLGTAETIPVRYLSGTTVAGTPQATCAALPGRQCTRKYRTHTVLLRIGFTFARSYLPCR